jgi:chaperonin GroES
MPTTERMPDRFSIADHLGDPEVQRGYQEQGAVVEAAALVRRMREAAGISQAALAARVGTSQAHLSMLERGVGRHGPTFLMLRKIAGACGQELDISLRPTHARAAPAAQPSPPLPTTAPRRFRPLSANDRLVVCRVHRAEPVTAGAGMFGAARETPIEGDVVAVGPDALTQPGVSISIRVVAGDRVLFGKWSGTEVSIDGEPLVVLTDDDIMGIIGG